MLAIVFVGLVCIFYAFQNQQRELISKSNFESRQKLIINNGAPKVQMVASYDELKSLFYNNLQACNPINLADASGINYVIFGKQNDKCAFELYGVFFSIKCIVPMDIAKKYADAGKSASSYIDEVNNNEEYCKLTY